MMQNDERDSRLYSVQSLWDNSMGEACADALDKYPNHLVLHVNGEFHSAYWDGIVHQLKARKPNANVKTVSIAPSLNPSTVRVEGEPTADFVVLAESRANDLNEGTWSVQTQQEIQYRLHIPPGEHSALPLLIWLNDDGLTSTDGLDLWKDRLGDKAAIVVVEAPFRETLGDLSVGGRWFWANSFAADMGRMVTGIERIWGYVMRHYKIDPRRICVAGEGAGGTIVAGVALLSDRMQMQAVAVEPARYSKLKDIPLPLAELWGDDIPPSKSLQVLGTQADKAWWSDELNQYKEQGLKTELMARTGDPWQRELQVENAVRKALGADANSPKKSKTRHYLLVSADMPRQRHWARLHAMWAEANLGDAVAVVQEAPDNAAEEIPLNIRPELCLSGDALPVCPGPFGGTTVIVVDQPQLDGWLDVEKNDPLAKKSRFYRVRIATLEPGNRNLKDVLTKLKSENRTNILIVPGVFCAEANLMRRLQREVGAMENDMTLQWLPGLGGQKLPLTVPPSAAPICRSSVLRKLSMAATLSFPAYGYHQLRELLGSIWHGHSVRGSIATVTSRQHLGARSPRAQSSKEPVVRTLCPEKVIVVFAMLFTGAAMAAESDLKPYQIDWSKTGQSVIDMSEFLESPAGGSGFIRVEGGRLVKPDGTRLRIWGVNLTGPECFPPQELAPAIVGDLARFGVNCVRFHHMDGPWSPLFDKSRDDTAEFDPQAIDRLDFFIAELKKRGIYSNLNLNVSRQYKPGDGVRDAHLLGYGKSATYFNPRLIQLQHDYARKLLRHRNPYTKSEYRHEPAIATVEMVNENSVLEGWVGRRLVGRDTTEERATWRPIPVSYAEELTDQYNLWLEKNVSADKLSEIRREAGNHRVERLAPPQFTQASTLRFTTEARFYMELERDFFEGMKQLLRDELDVKAPLVGTADHNDSYCGYAHVQSNRVFDYIDGHGYWQHPRTGSDFWIANTPMVNDPLDSTVTQFARTPVAGLPYTISETNHPYPAEFACEGIPILTAYALLQDWDGIYWFTYGKGRTQEPNQSWRGSFDFSNDPVKMTHLAACAAMFYRQDVDAAQKTILRVYGEDK